MHVSQPVRLTWKAANRWCWAFKTALFEFAVYLYETSLIGVLLSVLLQEPEGPPVLLGKQLSCCERLKDE